MTLKLAVIVDNGMIQRFALDALDAVAGTGDISVFSCTNTHGRRRWLRHGAYYALNLLTVRNRLTRLVPVASGKKRIVRQLEFVSEYDGAWQILPPHVLNKLADGGFDVILKFGMGLLRVPEPERLPVAILSYHHGDPDLYRGRPAGFWEMVEGQPTMGQIVQVIGNRLDAGKVVAFAETKVFPWSYRSTLIESFRHSPLLINTAIRNAMSGTYLAKTSEGRNWRLPSNNTVVAFLARNTMQRARRLFYGAFKEKRWQVSIAPAPEGLSQLPEPNSWQTLPTRPGYVFYADPFFYGETSILVEALRAHSGTGEIVRVDGEEHRTVLSGPGHISYPSTAVVDGREIVLPETASWSEPRAYVEDGGSLRVLTSLRVPNGTHISDPTLFQWKGQLYVFGNNRERGSNVLDLWVAGGLDQEFRLHPDSPIRISPKGSRMGGGIIIRDGRLFRVGQDFSRGYGDGLILFEIEQLSADSYSERESGSIRFTDRCGPHTLNVRGERVVFDWYHDRFSALAGFRRLAALARLQRRRATATQ
jgi:hypothetical protein